MRPDLHSERYGLLTSWYRSSQPTDARATGLVCIAVAVPFWASRPRFELTKAKSVRYLFPMFGTRGAHIAVIAEHEHHIEAQRFDVVFVFCNHCDMSTPRAKHRKKVTY